MIVETTAAKRPKHKAAVAVNQIFSLLPLVLDMQSQLNFGYMLPRALSSYTFKAEVDWMEFEVTLSSASQFRHIQDRMMTVWGKTHFAPLGDPESTRRFRFRLQNPSGPNQLMHDLQSMVRAGDPPIQECDVRVVGVEVAVDVYIEGGDRASLGEAALYLLRHMAHPPAGHPRITTAGARPVEPETIEEALRALIEDPITIHLGKKGADNVARIYVKTYDTVDGMPYAPLPPEQWRARSERTLRGTEVPFRTIGEWRCFRFDKGLADTFALVKSSATPDTLPALMQARLIQIGRRPDSPRRRPSDRRSRGPYTRRDSVMNDKIRQALRALTKSQSCQNSVNKINPRPLASEGETSFDQSSPEYCIPHNPEPVARFNTFPLSPQSLLTTAGAKVGVVDGSEVWVELGTVAGVEAEVWVDVDVDVDAMKINDFVDGLGCPFDPYPATGERS